MPPETAVNIRDRVTDLLDTVVASKPDGARRQGQDDMCAAVADAFDSGRHLLVEAPTGTGKSLAYLVPAVEFVLRERPRRSTEHAPRVVISTATKALQEQLVGSDLPFVADALSAAGLKFSYAMLKGRSNYLCRSRLAALEASATLFEDAAQDAVIAWAAETDTGDRAEAGNVPEPVWAKVSIGSNECPGASACPFGETCFTELARKRARTADIVVVNAHLYAAHLASDGNVLPEHDAVVFDEAHELEDILVSAFSVTLSAMRMYSAASLASVGGAPGEAATRLRDLAMRFDDACAPHVGETVFLSGATELVGVLTDIATACINLVDELGRAKPATPTGRDSNMQATSALRSLGDDIDTALGRVGESGVATWVEGDEDRPRFCAAQIDVGPMLARDLYPSVTVVATSATLAVGDRFDPIADGLGLSFDAGDGEAQYDTLRVDTPFEYERQGMLYVARHLPDPTKERAAFEPAAREELTELALAAGGRTLALFTSWAATRAAAEHLRIHTDLNVLCQGEASRNELVERFASTPRSVLVATSSFWTGLDLHGDQCTLVVIDRIPFGHPNDPVTAARIRLCEERGGNGFSSVTLPEAAITLAQGVGRLIRSTSDRGVVAVLDRRLATAGYRQLLLKTIPPLWKTADGERVRAALGRLDEAAFERSLEAAGLGA